MFTQYDSAEGAPKFVFHAAFDPWPSRSRGGEAGSNPGLKTNQAGAQGEMSALSGGSLGNCTKAGDTDGDAGQFGDVDSHTALMGSAPARRSIEVRVLVILEPTPSAVPPRS